MGGEYLLAADKSWIQRVDALAAQDAAHPPVSPASLLLRVSGEASSSSGPLHARCKLLAIGAPSQIDAHPASAQSLRISRPDCVLIPGLVNAHTHLDLTHIGPRMYDPSGGFAGFVDVVRRERRQDEHEIGQAVSQGVALSLAGGVVAVGDIAGAPLGRPSLAPWRALRSTAMRGISFLEFFAIGTGEERGLQLIKSTLAEAGEDEQGAASVRLALQPHAPYSVSLRAYDWVAAQSAVAASTHLAETPGEREFVASGTGPQREFLEGLRLWDDSILKDVGKGKTPVQHLGEVLRRRQFIAAHINDASDADIDLLSSAGTHVAYCPRASDYFGAHRFFGPHRYREMLARGVNVCLGTDSIIGLPSGSVSGPSARISVLDEMRFLFQRDGADPAQLLAMGTINGARALGLTPQDFSFEVGASLAGLVAVPVAGSMGAASNPLLQVMAGDSHPELLLLGK